MALIDPVNSRCAICDGLLDRPYAATSGCAFRPGHRLFPYCDTPLHWDCLASWPDREEFSREYFVRSLAHEWRSGGGRILKATARWFIGRRPFLESVFVSLRDWPLSVGTPCADWESFLQGAYLRDRDLPSEAIDALNAIMAEVRQHLPTLEALRELLAAASASPAVRRSFVEFGDYLATLWGEAAYYNDWEQWDSAERAFEQHWEERKRARAANIERSNAITEELARALESRGSLLCPHCHKHSHRVRYVKANDSAKSYFICGACGCSFAGSEALL